MYRSLQTISLIVVVQHIITLWKLCGGWVLTPGVCVSRHWKCSFSRVFVWKTVNEIKLQVLTNRGYASNVFHNCYTRLLPYYEPTNLGNECLVGEIELKNKNVPKIDFSPVVNWPLSPRNTWIRHELYIWIESWYHKLSNEKDRSEKAFPISELSPDQKSGQISPQMFHF